MYKLDVVRLQKSDRSWDRSVSIATRLQAGQPKVMAQLLTEARDFPLLQSIQAGSGAHLTSYSVDIWSYVPGGKVARA